MVLPKQGAFYERPWKNPGKKCQKRHIFLLQQYFSILAASVVLETD